MLCKAGDSPGDKTVASRYCNWLFFLFLVLVLPFLLLSCCPVVVLSRCCVAAAAVVVVVVGVVVPHCRCRWCGCALSLQIPFWLRFLLIQILLLTSLMATISIKATSKTACNTLCFVWILIGPCPSCGQAIGPANERLGCGSSNRVVKWSC